MQNTPETQKKQTNGADLLPCQMKQPDKYAKKRLMLLSVDCPPKQNERESKQKKKRRGAKKSTTALSLRAPRVTHHERLVKRVEHLF